MYLLNNMFFLYCKHLFYHRFFFPCGTERPLFFHEELQNQEAEEGESALLCCELSKPGVAVQWKKGAMLLKNGHKYEMTQEGNEVQLQIHDLTSQDSGTYRCCAGNIETWANIIVKGRNAQHSDSFVAFKTINFSFKSCINYQP